MNTTETDLTPDSSLGDPYAAGAVVITQSYGQAITRRLVEVSLRPTRHGYVVRWVRRRTRVTPPPRGFLDLVADRGPGNWLAHFVRHGALVQLQENTGGYSQVVGGGPLMVAGGRIADTIGDDQPPEAKTGAMLDRTGRWLTFVCFEGDSGGWGLTRHEFAGWMLAHGGYSGMMFDDGGSAELAVRPGARYHILNPLENNWQRPVAESLAVLG